MSDRKFFPIKLGVIAGMALGCAISFSFLSHRPFISSRLFNTVFTAIARDVDGCVLFASFISIAVFSGILRFLPAKGVRRRTRRFVRKLDSAFDRLALVCLATFLVVNVFAVYFRVRTIFALRHEPNIVFIIIDTVRADHVGCYGYERDTTPNLDKLAETSVKFDRVLAASSWTVPSISVFLTSQYQIKPLDESHDGWAVLSKSYFSMPEVLNDLGYRVSGVVSNRWLQEKYGYARGFEYYNSDCKHDGLSSPKVTKLALRQIDRLKEDRFFLEVHYMDVHVPYLLHNEYNFDPGYKGHFKDIVTVETKTDIPSCRTKSDLQYVKALYDSEVRFVDHHVGLLISELKRQGLYDNTMIVVLADHGEEHRDHGAFFHAYTLYNELLRVPLIIKLPGQKHGRTVKGTYSLLDLFPSLMGVLNYDCSHLGLQGVDRDLATISEIPDHPIFANTQADVDLWSVEDQGYKYILNNRTGKEMLFDLNENPHENSNVIELHPRIHAFLKKSVLDHMRMVKASVPRKNNKPHGSDKTNLRTRNRLRSLGYAQ